MAHADTLRALGDLVQFALGLAQRAAEDPDLGRLLRVFDPIPKEDRPVILEVLEREVEMRHVVGDALPTLTGLELLKPNPNARLYVRVFRPGATRAEAEATDHRDRVASTVQTSRILGLMLAPRCSSRGTSPP